MFAVLRKKLKAIDTTIQNLRTKCEIKRRIIYGHTMFSHRDFYKTVE